MPRTTAIPPKPKTKKKSRKPRQGFKRSPGPDLRKFNGKAKKPGNGRHPNCLLALKMHRVAVPNPHGRPSSYKPEYCEQVQTMMANGYFPVQIAAEIGVCSLTMSNWADANPEFAMAMSLGMELCESWWIEFAKENIDNRNFKTSVWAIIMAQKLHWRAKADLSEPIQVEHRHQHSGTIQQEHLNNKSQEEQDHHHADVLRYLLESGALDAPESSGAELDPQDQSVDQITTH